MTLLANSHKDVILVADLIKLNKKLSGRSAFHFDNSLLLTLVEVNKLKSLKLTADRPRVTRKLRLQISKAYPK